MGPIWMTLLLVSTLGFFSWSAFRRLRQVKVGVPDPRFSWEPAQIVDRAKTLLVYAFGQKRMPNYTLAGFAHVGIFVAFQVLLLNSLMLWGRGFDPDFDFWGLLSTDHLFGKLYSFAKELAAFAAIVGSVLFLYLRWGKRGVDSGDPKAVKDKPRMTLGHHADRYVFTEPILILFIIITMMGADFLYVGASLVLDSRAYGEPIHAGWWEPFGGIFAQLLSGTDSDGVVRAFQHAGFWWHSAFVLIFLNILPYSKHFHVLTVIPNVFAYERRPNALPKVDDLEGKVEREESLGINRISDLTYKHIMDLYTCTECGRCSDNCPAYITGKKLSPKHLTLAIRDHLYATEKDMFGKESLVEEPGDTPAAEPKPSAGEEPIHTFPAAPEGAYFVGETVVDLVPNILHPDVIWGCTSCRACEEQCPVMISYVDKIVGMRREEVMMKNEFPGELQGAFNGIETNGNPWNISAMDRADWADGLDIPLLSDKPDAEVLYWVGCAASYDDRAKKVARAVSKLLKKARVDFAILGTEETCTGDPARRAGNEYLFQMLAEQNVETLNGYEASKKTIITACPHCFNTLANEYSDFGGSFDVVHHTDFLNGLLVAGKLIPSKPVRGKVVYHDSCYLGRYNQVYDSPRQILESIEGLELTEVDYWNRKKGLCCGAGGAQMFMEEQGDERVNNKRTLQLLDTGATTVASACPFCMTMLTDGIKDEEKSDEVAQRDIAEILADAIELEEVEQTPLAAE
ncbi:MAG: (Fe-S)-binding protein [Deltaproteobacteria bacterium]|nr:(Fe-S)-binding protein [Deltaproteobacteria bacterium]NND30582.1 (Fe-S)-binding protein [Myxococcales bacterium]MBT8465121.1 (Fe-S)-binding protein [Deltaproteobacteria bacterium]MBT8480486.1 (Fe-S)-binding protein [Deltaproteobacteria bacterium]NNK06285.1 (Fe-S)-binding protein [Myxococcales bacterium]